MFYLLKELSLKFKEAKCLSESLKFQHIELEKSKRDWQEKLNDAKHVVLKGLKLDPNKFSVEIDDDGEVSRGCSTIVSYQIS